MESQLRVGIDVGCHAHRVGIADPAGSILEEFDISHSEAGFREFFRRVEERRAERVPGTQYRTSRRSYFDQVLCPQNPRS